MKTLTTKRADTLRFAWMASQQAARIGQRIRERRLELDGRGRDDHMTQRELADKVTDLTGRVGIDGNYVSRWERGEHRPNDTTLDAIADALQTSVADLMAGPLADRKSPGETPDLMAAVNNGETSDLREQLDAIRKDVAEIKKMRQKDIAEIKRLLEVVSAQIGERATTRPPRSGRSR